MENQRVVFYEDADFESYKVDNIGVIKIKKNVFEIITDLPESSKFMRSLKTIEKDTNIEGILILNENDCLGPIEYQNYLKNVFSKSNTDEKLNQLELSNRETRTRELVILNNLIRQIVQSSKLVVNAVHGEVVTPFFGASFAADLRLAASNTVFLLSHSTLGVHPSGALPYFLPKFIGQAKASQILFCRDSISADEALELGIIYEILPVDKFEEIAIEKVRKILDRGSNVLQCTKRLLNNNFEDLEKYLNMEECNFLRR